MNSDETIARLEHLCRYQAEVINAMVEEATKMLTWPNAVARADATDIAIVTCGASIIGAMAKVRMEGE